jgi:hypothetical protein
VSGAYLILQCSCVVVPLILSMRLMACCPVRQTLPTSNMRARTSTGADSCRCFSPTWCPTSCICMPSGPTAARLESVS